MSATRELSKIPKSYSKLYANNKLPTEQLNDNKNLFIFITVQIKKNDIAAEKWELKNDWKLVVGVKTYSMPENLVVCKQ